MARSVLISFLVVGLLASALCQQPTTSSPPLVTRPPTTGPTGPFSTGPLSSTLECPLPPPHCPRTWSYSGASQWGGQCADWSTCSSGTSQSPVDIPPPAYRYSCDNKYQVGYGNVSNLCLFNTGNFYVFPVQPNSGNYFSFNGMTYSLSKVEFHSPSNHLVQGRRFDLEVDFYHTSLTASKKTLVTAVFFNRSRVSTDPGPVTNPFLEQFGFLLPEFSDCSCGNGKIESLAGDSRFVGVNETCDYFSNPQSGCCTAGCTIPRCGDGNLDPNESCDNGTGNSNTTANACRLNCCLPYCGDGIRDSNEECDDRNNQNGDGCSSICLRECGNGRLNAGLEQCDNGALNSNTAANACRLNCRLPFCGDGVKDANEACDNGTFMGTNPSQCRLNCTLPFCGDGITDNNEECDLGAGNNGPNSTCSTSCRSNCGDGVISGDEECDDGPLNSNYPDATCRTNCLLARCGDGIVDSLSGEQCDSIEIVDPFDPNSAIYANRYCSSNCTQLCGSGRPDTTTKACDNGCGNSNIPNNCRTDCNLPTCGDGIIDSGEQCDTGSSRSNLLPNACRMNCTVARCGDGVLDNDEGCDDGNRVSGDGCSANCYPECGNGFLDAGEECDYGTLNANTPNSCRSNCRFPRCGDGILDSLEECDGGANNSDTAAGACRTNCRRPYCGDGIIDYQLGEKCDFGANNSDTARDGCSLFCIPNYCRQRCSNGTFDLSLGVPTNQTSYMYSGSLPYPPCSEDTQWVIFDSVQPMSAYQYRLFTNSSYRLNGSRPVQPLRNRTVKRPCDAPPPQCGNGIQDAGEQCDLGAALNSDWEANKCRSNCSLPYCGDGVTDRGEECDDGYVSSTRCSVGCKLMPVLRNPYAMPPWSYPNTCKWVFLSPRYASCAGNQQSPINFETSVLSANGTGRFQLPITSATVSNYTAYYTGRSLALVFASDSGNTFSDFGKSYQLSRIEFHSPSEHTFDGYYADVEADFIHMASDGTYVNVAVLFNRTDLLSTSSTESENSWLSQFLFYLPRQSECAYGNGIVEPAIGEQCDDGYLNSNYKPDRCRMNGLLPFFGDGVLDRGEQCDNGGKNGMYPNGCRSNGRLAYCGDGVVDAGEQCDSSAGCATNCTLLCGNGAVDAGEQCDQGANNNDARANACRSNCMNPRCGDGVQDAGEQCDFGPSTANYTEGCRSDCRLAYCGDGILDFSMGEECDEGNNNGPSSRCLSNCTLNCGNGVVEGVKWKECDDGPMNSNEDGRCRTTCILPYCGDGIVDTSLGEQCDPGYPLFAYNSTCSAGCRLLCGNGVLDVGEECDNGARNSDLDVNACRTNCRNAYCGDGVLDCGEACDAGSLNSNSSNSTCRSNCALPRCGDGVVDTVEGCDDGNLVSGDGCSSTCHSECGNGMRDGNESCDDGAENGNTPNSCRMNCVLPRCGDGIVDNGEQCDQGTAANGASPNACRSDCTLPVCGDGILDTYYGEQCDLGVTNNNDFSGSCSTTCVLNDCRRSYPPAGTNFTTAGLFTNSSSPVVTYTGSLVTPPCTENVRWYVLQQPQSLSERQFLLINSLIRGNRRGLQSLNGRTYTYTSYNAATCGNCVVERGEECDGGALNSYSANACRPNCVKARCGDGILDAGEECDNGTLNSNTGACTTGCLMASSCPSFCNLTPCENCEDFSAWRGCDCQQYQTATTQDDSTTVINVKFEGILRAPGCVGKLCQGVY